MSYWIKIENGDLINLDDVQTISIDGREKPDKKNVGVYADTTTIKKFGTRQEAEKLRDLLFKRLCSPSSQVDRLNLEKKQ